MATRLQGIFTPNLVLFDDAGRINEPEMRRYIDWLIDRGVHGLYPNGSTGEFTRFTVDERRRIIEIVVDQTRGRVPILAGAAEANVQETLAACEYYHRLGVRAVAIVAPFYYRSSPPAVYAYFRDIGRNTPIDVTLYNIPMFASPIDVPTVQRLADECPRIVAIKDSSGDLPHMMRMIEAVRPRRPDFSFLTGWDAVLMPMMLLGCDGGTNASSGIVPELTRKLYDSVRAGQLDEGRRLQYLLLRLFDAMILGVDFPEGIRAALRARGFRTGVGRQPVDASQQPQLAALEQRFRELLSAEGFGPTGAPAASSAAASSTADPQWIAQVVQSVIGELQRQGMGVGRN
jgi:4-hydroxy-tetrahydrodipicolinate synthase